MVILLKGRLQKPDAARNSHWRTDMDEPSGRLNRSPVDNSAAAYRVDLSGRLMSIENCRFEHLKCLVVKPSLETDHANDFPLPHAGQLRARDAEKPGAPCLRQIRWSC
jgi:hypothetical protein